MNVAVDARPLVYTRAGVAEYLRGIIGNVPEKIRFSLCLPGPLLPGDGLIDSPSVTQNIIRLPRIFPWCGRFWERALLPQSVGRSKANVFWGPRFHAPERLRIPAVVTVHDLAFKKVPGLVPASKVRHFTEMAEAGVLRADTVLCVSQTTARDTVEHFGVEEKKLAVVYNGFDRFYREIPKAQAREIVGQRLDITEPYMLFVGTIEPRKNLARLIDAFVVGGFHNDFRLVLAGGWGWLSDDVQERVAGAPPGSVIVTGYVDKECLRALYNACSAFVFPSLYEGFGIPVLEAMACGAPVACADNSALAELFSDSAVLFDERSVSDMARGIREALDRGRELAAAGCEKAQHFGWDRCAAETVSVMERLAA